MKEDYVFKMTSLEPEVVEVITSVGCKHDKVCGAYNIDWIKATPILCRDEKELLQKNPTILKGPNHYEEYLKVPPPKPSSTKLERQHGCKYCKGITYLMVDEKSSGRNTVINHAKLVAFGYGKGKGECVETDINYCPICGAKINDDYMEFEPEDEKDRQKCKYCESDFPLVTKMIYGACSRSLRAGIIIKDPNKLVTYGYNYRGCEDDEISTEINYCPICGRELKGERK
jgi:hypothetical protein